MAYDKAVDSAQLDANLAAVADAIRAKGGTDAQLAFPSGFAAAIQAIETGGTDVIAHADIPAYVKAEALAVADKVKAVLKSDSIVFLAISDFHHAGEQTDGWQTNINAGNLHACQALSPSAARRQRRRCSNLRLRRLTAGSTRHIRASRSFARWATTTPANTVR